MRKLLGIFAKQNKLEISNYNNIITNINHLSNSNLNNTFIDEHFFLTTYCNSENDIDFYKYNNQIYAYAGSIYFNFIPENNIEIEYQKYRHIISNIETRNLIKGNYNIIKYDTKTNELKIYNDSIGLFTLFIYEDFEVLIFCNDYEPIALFKDNKYKINLNAVIECVLFGSSTNNKTFFKNINILPKNSILNACADTVKIENNFLHRKIEKYKNTNEIVEHYFITFQKEINNIIAWFPNIELSLTGGIDTRLILGCINDDIKCKIKFFTFRNNFISDDDNQDIIIAKRLVKIYGLNHYISESPIFNFYDIDNKYFQNLQFIKSEVITGQFGTETLRFQNANPLANSFVEKVFNARLRFKTIKYINDKLLEVNKYFLSPPKKISDVLYNEIKIAKKEHNNNFLKFSINNITRSFFSNHWQGAKGKHIMPALLERFLLSPFITEEILAILFTVNIKLLSPDKLGIYNLIFKEYLEEYTKIETNSLLAQYDNVFMPIKKGKNQFNYSPIKYRGIDEVFNDPYIKNLNLFNIQNIQDDFHFMNNPNKYIWYDILYWLNYIGNLK